jgi:GT2 family glycosyltransferase
MSSATRPEPRLAAIVCTIARPREVAACAASLLAQTAANLEVFVVDQSPDGAIATTLAPLRQADPRLRYLHTDRAGKTRAQNLAIRRSDADIFLFTDDDCLVPPDWAQRLVDTFWRLPDAGLLFGEVHRPAGHDWATEFSPCLSIAREQRLRPAFLPRVNYLFGCSMAVRREVFERIGLFDETLGPGGQLAAANEEVEFHLRALRARPPVGVYLTPAFHVVHEYGSRPQGEPTRQLLRAYERGKTAMLTKYALRGDAGAACKLALLAFEPFVDGAVNLVRTGRPRGVGMIVPYFQGLARAVRLARHSPPVPSLG